MEGRAAEGNTVVSVLDTHLVQSRHIYQDSFYNSVKLAKAILDKNTGVCGTLRSNRGIPHNLGKETKDVRKGKLSFWRKDDIMVQVWKDRRPVQMISAIRDLGMLNMGRKDIKTNLEVKKLHYIVQCSKFVKIVDRADQYLIYYSVLKKTVKLSKKVVVCLINYALFHASSVLCVHNPEQKHKNKRTKFLHESQRS
jgi:hypothetical protein